MNNKEIYWSKEEVLRATIVNLYNDLTYMHIELQKLKELHNI